MKPTLKNGANSIYAFAFFDTSDEKIHRFDSRIKKKIAQRWYEDRREAVDKLIPIQKQLFDRMFRASMRLK